jgi:hypothetical protein
VHRGRFRPFPRGKSRRAPSGPTALGDEVFLGFFFKIIIYLFCDVVEVVSIQKPV